MNEWSLIFVPIVCVHGVNSDNFTFNPEDSNPDAWNFLTDRTLKTYFFAQWIWQQLIP